MGFPSGFPGVEILATSFSRARGGTSKLAIGLFFIMYNTSHSKADFNLSFFFKYVLFRSAIFLSEPSLYSDLGARMLSSAWLPRRRRIHVLVVLGQIACPAIYPRSWRYLHYVKAVCCCSFMAAASRASASSNLCGSLR